MSPPIDVPPDLRCEWKPDRGGWLLAGAANGRRYGVLMLPCHPADRWRLCVEWIRARLLKSLEAK